MKKHKNLKTQKDGGFDSYIKNFSKINSKVFSLVSFLKLNFDNCIKIKSFQLSFKQVWILCILRILMPSSPGKFELKQLV